jgi:hypothetical protein
MSSLNLKPTHAPVKKYYATIRDLARGHFDKEGNIRGAFEDLLKHCARQYDWTLVPEYSIPRKDRNPLSVDAALLDAFNLPRGYWEAKNTKDSLEAEMRKKFWQTTTHFFEPIAAGCERIGPWPALPPHEKRKKRFSQDTPR